MRQIAGLHGLTYAPPDQGGVRYDHAQMMARRRRAFFMGGVACGCPVSVTGCALWMYTK